MNGAAKKFSGYAWAVVALLWPVVLLNYLDRQMVSTIRASIRSSSSCVSPTGRQISRRLQLEHATMQEEV